MVPIQTERKPTQYSDGGYTGANIDRPGVRQLLAD
jgi:hypothetical protein